MKLVNLGHAQTDETRTKIGVGVRLGWERRRKRLMQQETCYYEWQNLIAFASHKGLLGEEELQWNSFKVLNKQLENEWLQSVEQRRNTLTLKPKGSRRAPKSAEQKRKISAAIAAKWTEPEYRGRVCSALAKFHGIPESIERKPRRKPSVDGETRKSPKKKNEADIIAKHEYKDQIQQIRLKKRKTPLYKDPLASSKLEMIKNIRAQRATPTNKKTEAITRARLLIAEAEKAAEGLVIAAENSPLAQASLVESRMLIAEAIQFMEALEKEDPLSFENDNDLSGISTEPITLKEEETDADTQNLDLVNHKKVNGVHSLLASGSEKEDFSFNNFVSDLVKGNCLLTTEEDLQQMSSNGFHSPELNKPNPNGSKECMEKPLVNGLEFQEVKQANVVKKWVRGRLVEVEEEA
ncbi:hypothetical protein ACJIZ3_021078 [Penstemon smallii]|uniref:Nuclease associated modular domain-containing protein n=1 Tax=Penstemon smallii TaxID=265156 RepID=A0ABD3SKF3_9LAMI